MPPAPPSLAHLTLATGHLRASPRHEVRDDTIAVCAALFPVLLDPTTMAPTASIPGVPNPYYLAASRVGGNGLLCLVLRDTPSESIATFGVAPDESSAPALWDELHACAHDVPVTTGLALPPAPWCAVALHRGVVHHHRALEWLGDFERCVAWAWIERGA